MANRDIALSPDVATNGFVLLMGDVDSIKDYVFETSSLPQIRGGSQILIECEETIRNLVEEKGGEVIYCSGGGFLFKVPVSKVKNIKETIEQIYITKTLVTTVTVVHETLQSLPHVQHPPQGGWAERLHRAHFESQQTGDFSRCIAFLGARLREAKLKKATAPFMETFPFGKRCEACGKRMATKTVPRYVDKEGESAETISLCMVCVIRHERGSRRKGESVRGRFNRCFADKFNPTAQAPPDLSHMTQSARRKYIAFIYADGNDIGRLLQLVRNGREFRALSQALTEGSRQALFDALYDVCCQSLKEDEYWPFEIVNIGGDDVTLLIQAGYAWDAAVNFLGNFEKYIKKLVEQKLSYWPEHWPDKITASCGIAIADVKYPVRYLEYLATDLLKQAKKEARMDSEKNPRSSLTYLWLPNPIASDRIEPLMNAYSIEKGSATLKLTCRPYTLDQAQKICKLIDIASQQPRSLRYRWSEALSQGMHFSINLIHYDIARRKDDKRQLLYSFLSGVSHLVRYPVSKNGPVVNFWGYEKTQGTIRGYETPLLDILELAELRAMRGDTRKTSPEED